MGFGFGVFLAYERQTFLTGSCISPRSAHQGDRKVCFSVGELGSQIASHSLKPVAVRLSIWLHV